MFSENIPQEAGTGSVDLMKNKTQAMEPLGETEPYLVVLGRYNIVMNRGWSRCQVFELFSGERWLLKTINFPGISTEQPEHDIIF